ncbi:hypothetical protein [Georgenia sp. SUBG003]|uniref:hypothetical protein n=1 Tax=Georgenia sp. SUBG003 TaxID=1497974 RepID=UPI000693887B
MLWRRKGESQVGVDPRCAVVLEDLTPGEQNVLDYLRHDPTEADLVRVGRASGVPAERVQELLTLLERSGVLAPAAPPRPPGDEEAPDAAYWSRLLPDGDGVGLMARRASATVRVVGLDQVGMRIAAHLAEAGIGTLLLDDDCAVQEHDVGPYHPRDVGAPRRARAEAQLRSVFPRLLTDAPAGARPDVLVAVSSGVADPVRLLPLVREDVVHLPVVVGDVDVAVGPLVVPGRGPCTRCLDLHRTDADPAWPALATQLRVAPSPPVPSNLAQLGSAVAASQVLAAVDGRRVVADGTTIEVGGLSPLPLLRPWTVHPGCGCAGVGPECSPGEPAREGPPMAAPAGRRGNSATRPALPERPTPPATAVGTPAVPGDRELAVIGTS